MDAKKLIAGGMAALLLTNILGFPIQALAAATQQEAGSATGFDTGLAIGSSLDTGSYAAGNAGLAMDSSSDTGSYAAGNTEPEGSVSHMPPMPDMRASFYLVDGFTGQTGGLSLKNVQADTSYSLSESAWANSGSDYYFSQLNTAEKKLYLNLKTLADIYLTGTDNFQVTEVNRDGQAVQVHILPLMSYSGLATDQMKKVFYCFLFENPQYYFIRNSVIYSENTGMMTVGLYGIFADGNTRAGYTRQLAGQLDVWEQQVSAKETAAEKELLIHNLVLGHVDYNSGMDVDDPDDKEMSQSCISAVLFGHSTVCAGYAQMFSLLCNRAGIACVTVTSESHAWNKVRMGNTWYDVDCTWNDCRGDDVFFNVTDEKLLAADSKQQEHIPSPEWEGLLPACTAEFDPGTASGTDPGTNVAAPDKTVETVSLSWEDGGLSVRFSPTEGCDGYSVQYATNGAMLEADKTDTEVTSCVLAVPRNESFVRVRGYVLNGNGEKLYGPFSKKAKIGP